MKLTPIQRELLRAAVRNKVQADRALRRIRTRLRRLLECAEVVKFETTAP